MYILNLFAWHNIKYGVLNLIIFFRVIWNFRSWDFGYVLPILIKALEQLYESGIEHAYDNSKFKKLKTVICLLKRIEEDNYYDNITMFHDKKWGKPEFSWISMEDGEYSQLEINHKNAITEEDKIQQNKEFLRLKSDEDIKKSDMEYTCKLIQKHFLTWWHQELIMGLITKSVTITQNQVMGFTCDVCGKSFFEDDFINFQEALIWNNECGYGSVWGDGSLIELNICQQCLFELFEEKVTYLNPDKQLNINHFNDFTQTICKEIK